MIRQFEIELRDLKSRILAMGSLVEEAIEKSTLIFYSRDRSIVDQVRAIENKINEENMAIDNTCLEVLARLSPVATDLRLIVAIIKINTDLERMGDQAVNISYNVDHYQDDGEVSGEVEASLKLPAMAEMVKKMVRDSLLAFMNNDVVLARDVLERDDLVDQNKASVLKKMIAHMKGHSHQIESSLDMILIARNLERMADHATNIAEDVIFACTGKDIRHGIGKSEENS